MQLLSKDELIIESGNEIFGKNPLVSILCFVKNAEMTIERCVDSVLTQTYGNIEFVIQDGRSTDDTLKIIKSFRDKRVRLISETDKGPSDAFAKAIARAKGQIIGTCLSDEELVADAVEKSVDAFRKNPHVGAITGDAYLIDYHGNIIGEHKSEKFDYAKYLFADYCPYWSSSFFSLKALKVTGLLDDRWSKESIEFEIWARLGALFEVLYVEHKFSKYALHEKQLSNDFERCLVEFDARLKLLKEEIPQKVLGPSFFKNGPWGNFVDSGPSFSDYCVAKQYWNLVSHLVSIGKFKEGAILIDQLHEHSPHYSKLTIELLKSRGFDIPSCFNNFLNSYHSLEARKDDTAPRAVIENQYAQVVGDLNAQQVTIRFTKFENRILGKLHQLYKNHVPLKLRNKVYRALKRNV